MLWIGRCSTTAETSNSPPCHRLGSKAKSPSTSTQRTFQGSRMGSTSTLQRMRTEPRSTASPPVAHRQQFQARWLCQRLPFLWRRQRRTEHPLLQRQRHRVQLAQGRELSELRRQTFPGQQPLPLPANAPVGTQGSCPAGSNRSTASTTTPAHRVRTTSRTIVT